MEGGSIERGIGEDLRFWGRNFRAYASHTTWYGTDRNMAAARAALEEHIGPSSLPAYRDPLVSVVLLAKDALRTAALIKALLPVIVTVRGELLLVDDGTDPLVRLLAGQVRNLRYIFDASAHTTAGAGNLAGDMARSQHFVLLDDEGFLPSASALEVLACYLATGDRAFFSERCYNLISRFAGLPIPMLTQRRLLAGRLGVRLAMPWALWWELGTFDTDLAYMDGLETADLILKADLAGIPWEVLAEPSRAGGTVLAPDKGRVTDARWIAESLIKFRHRWEQQDKDRVINTEPRARQQQ